MNYNKCNVIIFCVVFYCLIFVYCANKDISEVENCNDIVSIVIDPDSCEKSIDLSSIINNDIEIIKLETTDDCLVSEINKIEFRNNEIFISDQLNQKIFVFDSNGKYLRSIGKQGYGPGEYLRMGDFEFVNDLIYMQDIYSSKCLIYDLRGKYISDLSPIPSYHNILSFDSVLYFVSNYKGSDYGDFNLFRYDFKSQNITTYLPYDKDIREGMKFLGIINQVSKYNDSALLLYPRSDIVYEVNAQSYCPKYKIKFTKYNLPEDIKEKEGIDMFRYSKTNNCIIGLSYILNSQKYLFAAFGHGRIYKHLLYDKLSQEVKIGNVFQIVDLGDLYLSHFFTYNDELVIIQDTDDFTRMWKSVYSRGEFNNTENYEKMKKIYDLIKNEENPVIIKIKLK